MLVERIETALAHIADEVRVDGFCGARKEVFDALHAVLVFEELDAEAQSPMKIFVHVRHGTIFPGGYFT